MFIGAVDGAVEGFEKAARVGVAEEEFELSDLIRIKPHGAVGAAEPIEFFLSGHENAAEDQGVDAFGVGLGVGEAECAAPAGAVDQPVFDFEVGAEDFDIRHQMLGGIVLDAAGWGAFAGAALVKTNNPVCCGVKAAGGVGREAAAGAAVQHHRGEALGIAVFGHI